MHYRFKHIYTFILGILLCVSVSSCFKDKGNYEYTELDNIGIDTFGTKAGFYLDSMIVTPHLWAEPDSSILNDTSRWSYVWTAAIVNRVASKGDVPLLTLSTDKVLRIKLTMRPELYVLRLKVTDKATGKIYNTGNYLTVATTVYEGWLMLTDINNTARVDMVSFLPSPFTDTLVLTDVLAKYNIPAMHGPRDISFTAANQGQYVYVTAADGGHKLDGDVFYWQSSYGLQYECLFEYGANFSPGYVRNSSGSASYLLYYDKNYYYQNQVTSAGYGLPINRVAGETADFDASPYIGKPLTVSGPAVLFDRTKKRFVRWTEGGATCAELAEPAAPKFSFKPNMDLLYMVTNQSNSYTYAVMKDPATGKVWVFCFTLLASSLVQNFAVELGGTDIDKAELFAVNPEFGYLFYNVGGKVYEVDYDNPTTSKLAVDLGSKKISLLKFHQFRSYTNVKFAPIAKNLLIGSYDSGLPVEKCGTLSQYAIPGLVGTPVLVKSYSGMGKIVSLTYRER